MSRKMNRITSSTSKKNKDHMENNYFHSLYIPITIQSGQQYAVLCLKKVYLIILLFNACLALGVQFYID